MKKESWLIIANSGCMKLFRFPSDSRKLTEAETIYNEERHKRAQDVNTDKEGRSQQSFGSGSSAYERHTDLKKLEQEGFAEQIAKFLHDAAIGNEFDRLYLAVSKEFYGILKNKLSSAVHKKLAEETHKDLVHEKLNAIWGHFPSMK